jgi:hypothetical protein
MKRLFQFALIGTSIFVLTSPVLARKGDNMTSGLITGATELNTAPPGIRQWVPERMFPVYG